jgi:replication initiation protein RepC
VRRRRAEIEAQGEGGNDHGRAHKWKVIRALGEARTRFALSDRSIAVLEALVSVLPGKELDAASDMIVFPSNAELSARTNGMALPRCADIWRLWSLPT